VKLFPFIFLVFVLLLSGCGSWIPSITTGGGGKISQEPTKGGDATVSIYPDRTEISLNQPENTEEQSFIELHGIPVVMGHDKDGKQIIDKTSLKVVVGGTTPLSFEKVEGFGGQSMASLVGYGAIVLGVLLIVARFVPALSLFITTWKLGGATIASGFSIIMIDRFLAQYGMISIMLLIIVLSVYMAYRHGHLKDKLIK